MAATDAAFLLAIGRALVRVHLGDVIFGSRPLVHIVDPVSGQIGKSGKVLGLALKVF
jgi:hypothetical protein